MKCLSYDYVSSADFNLTVCARRSLHTLSTSHTLTGKYTRYRTTHIGGKLNEHLYNGATTRYLYTYIFSLYHPDAPSIPAA
ncbi:hypothetical protein Plhal304r1_c015g0054971 [Plasmopara halstedii]